MVYSPWSSDGASREILLLFLFWKVMPRKTWMTELELAIFKDCENSSECISPWQKGQNDWFQMKSCIKGPFSDAIWYQLLAVNYCTICACATLQNLCSSFWPSVDDWLSNICDHRFLYKSCQVRKQKIQNMFTLTFSDD